MRRQPGGLPGRGPVTNEAVSEVAPFGLADIRAGIAGVQRGYAQAAFGGGAFWGGPSAGGPAGLDTG